MEGVEGDRNYGPAAGADAATTIYGQEVPCLKVEDRGAGCGVGG